MFEWLTKPEYQITTLDKLLAIIEIIGFLFIVSFIWVVYLELKQKLKEKTKNKTKKD